MGIPIPLDRVFLLICLALLARDHRAQLLRRVIRWRPIHMLLALLVAVAVSSAFWAGTWRSRVGVYSLLDRLGIVPFLLFALAPVLVPDERRRTQLLMVLAGLGAYLGLTTLFEAVKLNALVWPHYINDPSIGIHFGRGRGPFAEAVANGLALFATGTAAGIVGWQRQRRPEGVVCLAICGLCTVSLFFTLTRAVWLAGCVGILVAAIAARPVRTVVVRAAPLLAVAIVVALLVIPGLRTATHQRTSDQRSIWDRLNTNNAATAIVAAHPLTGVGWEGFVTAAPSYMRQAASYPLTGDDLEVHNVLLSHAAELGLPATALWLVCLGGSVGLALVTRAEGDLQLWRLGLLVLAIDWAVTGSFTPLAYAFPNLLLWLWTGIVLTPYLSRSVKPSARWLGARAS